MGQVYSQADYTVHIETNREESGEPGSGYFKALPLMQLSTPVVLSSYGANDIETICEDVQNYLEQGLLTHPMTGLYLGENRGNAARAAHD